MTEAQLQNIGKYLLSKGYFEADEYDDFWMEDWIGDETNFREIARLISNYADEQVKKERAGHILDRMDWVNEGVKMACDEIEKSLPSDEEILQGEPISFRSGATWVKSKVIVTINKLKKG